MRRVMAIALVGALALGAGSLSAPAMADVLEAERDQVLRGLTAQQVAIHRSKCATGAMAADTADLRAAGFRTLSAGAYCVTVLTRAGRDRTLGFMSLANGKSSAAITFDSGFVSGFLKRPVLPSNAPAMVTLLPIADRCVARTEANMRLCSSIGYVLGARAAQGELVPVT